ncbi:hypothetical protein [Streptomyces sp. NPDC002104]
MFGAYALSAGLRPLVFDDADEITQIAFKALHTILVKAQASGPDAYRHGIEAVADLVAVWRADLLRIIRQRLLPIAYEYADHVPPLASSPCGVIRMASPRVPRGSLRALQLDLAGPSGASFPSWVLAA